MFSAQTRWLWSRGVVEEEVGGSHESHLTTLPSIPAWGGCEPLQNRKRGGEQAGRPERLIRRNQAQGVLGI